MKLFQKNGFYFTMMEMHLLFLILFIEAFILYSEAINL